MIRITEGSSKGRSLKSPDGNKIRPTSSKTRQALFNILRPRLKSCRFLDVCAGTGIMGLEALSRGAAELTAVEENDTAVRIMRQNLHKLDYQARIIRGNCTKVLPRLPAFSFDIIFADPPYRTTLADDILGVVGQSQLLSDNGVLIIEHSRKNQLARQVNDLSLFDSRNYGLTQLSFYQRL